MWDGWIFELSQEVFIERGRFILKKASIQLKYDEEKLSALEKYMIKKEVDLEVELLHTLQNYMKICAAGVREYIESRETCEGRTGMRSQERRNTANRSNEGILETGEGTWSTENS